MNNDLIHKTRIACISIFASAISLCASSCVAQDISHIDVFAEFTVGVPESFDARITYWDLLAPEKIKARYFPHELSGNEEEAKAQFTQFLSTNDGKQFIDAMKKAYQPMVLMTQLKVEKIPAIVIDKKYVIYGSTNVDDAIREYEQFKSRGGR